jgi:hypothetical protein
MAYGLTITNDSNQVLIDSDLFGYHYIGKFSATTSTTHTYLDDLGGEDYWNTPNTIDANQTPGRVFEYTINLPGSTKPPMCFIKPTNTGTSARYTSVVRVWKYNANNWKVWALQSSDSTTGPMIYAFSTMDQTNSTVTDTHGMQTFNSAGEVTFDSRRKPLRVIGAADALPPASPNSGSLGSGTEPYLDVSVTPNTYTTGANTPASDQIYYCPSLASACNEHEHTRQTSGYNNWSYYTWSRYDIWWCFYRSAFRISADNTFQSNWAVYMAGHIWKAQVAGSFLGLGYLNGNPVVGASAYYPYSDSARNQGEANSVLISKASYYD